MYYMLGCKSFLKRYLKVEYLQKNYKQMRYDDKLNALRSPIALDEYNVYLYLPDVSRIVQSQIGADC